MLNNWLNPAEQFQNKDESSINKRVLSSYANTGLRRQKVFMVTDSSKFARDSKYALFQLKDHFEDLELYDLGSLKNDNPEFVIGIIRELASSEGRIIFLSKQDSYFDSIFRALEHVQGNISMAFMNSTLDQLLEESTARSLQSNSLLNISALGYQRHFCTPRVLSYLYESFVHHLSFGQMRQDISKVEPILRSTTAASIDTAILVNNDLGSPNGINPLEICQIAKYCGMSTSLKVLSISDQNSPSHSDNSALVGQMLWYFIEGLQISEQDNNKISTPDFQEHLVQTDYSNYSFTFWKSKRTNRWWFEIPNAEGKRGNVYPCNQEDYALACRNEISEYLLDQINLDH